MVHVLVLGVMVLLEVVELPLVLEPWEAAVASALDTGSHGIVAIGQSLECHLGKDSLEEIPMMEMGHYAAVEEVGLYFQYRNPQLQK